MINHSVSENFPADVGANWFCLQFLRLLSNKLNMRFPKAYKSYDETEWFAPSPSAKRRLPSKGTTQYGLLPWSIDVPDVAIGNHQFKSQLSNSKSTTQFWILQRLLKFLQVTYHDMATSPVFQKPHLWKGHLNIKHKQEFSPIADQNMKTPWKYPREQLSDADWQIPQKLTIRIYLISRQFKKNSSALRQLQHQGSRASNTAKKNELSLPRKMFHVIC